MDITQISNVILPIVLALLGIAVIVLVIELIKILKSARVMLEETRTHLTPTLANVEEMTESIKPVVAKIDPLVDRVQLTLDAANLEMMRVDEILEDITQITGTASSATAAVDKLSNAPMKAMTNVATRVRTALGPKDASTESVRIAQADSEVNQALEDFRASMKDDANAKPASEPAEAVEHAESAKHAKPAEVADIAAQTEPIEIPRQHPDVFDDIDSAKAVPVNEGETAAGEGSNGNAPYTEWR